jgi:outer membrane receptor protein involved in Fe transport
MHRSLMARFVLLAALVVASSGALAQGITGSAVTGSVKDPEGTPVPDATVQLRNPATGQAFRAVTGPSGRYFIDNVPPGGPYELTATAPGYQTTTHETGIQLALGQRLAIDVPLRYSGEAIEIVSHADSLDDHARTGPSTTVKEEAIAKLPLQGRNFTNLIATDPRVTVTGTGVSIAGQNDRLNNIQIDGGANNDLFGLASNGTPGGQANAKPLSIEAIREFVVQVAPFDVRLGNFTGGLVNAITKSGTNDFHGSVFGYFQNKTLANKKAFITSGTPPATNYVVDPAFQDYTVWQFGGAVGGPIIKDKVHFFIATDIQQRKSAFGSRFNMIGDPTYDKANAGFDTTAVDRFTSILGKYGITNAGDYTAPSVSNPDRNVFVKVSTSAIENSNLELSYNFVNASLDQLIRNPTAPGIPNRLRDGYELSNSGYAQTTTTHTVRGKLTSNFDGGKVSNELLVGASFIRDARKLPNQAPLILVQAGALGASPAWLAAGGERFSQANALDQDIYQVQDNVSFTLDKHRLVVGTSNEFLRIRNLFLQAATGVWAFNSLNEFDAGTPAAFQRRLAVPGAPGDPGTVKFNAVQLGFYVQDEWSVLRNLTLTPGVRVDVPILSKASTNTVVSNSPYLPIDTGKVPSGNPLWSPRLGFNWDVDGSSDTIVRGGVGVFSGRPAYVWVSNAYGMNGLSSVELTCTGAAVPAFSADPNAQPEACKGATGTSPPPGEIDYFDPKTRYPQNLRLALGADRRLPFGIVGSADFLYTRDINGWYVTDENLTVVGSNSEGRTLYGAIDPATGRPTPARVDTTNPAPYVKVSNKNGGYVTTASVQLQKQLGQLFAVSVGYAYSRSFDRMSLTSSQALSNFQFAPLDGDIQNRAVRPSAFDRPHKVTITGTANLPLGFGVGLSYVGQSGLPYSWTVSGDANGDGLPSNDLVFVPADPSQITLKDPTQYAALDNFINSQDCLRKARGGIIKRGACRNSWQQFLDLRLTWTSPNLKGEQRIEFQWDIFNVLNLLNKNWGHFDQDAQFESGPPAFLAVAGYDKAANRPIYSFRAPTAAVTQTLYSPTQSRWRMQLGARYVF